jgi:predicted nucleic acid-binding protein
LRRAVILLDANVLVASLDLEASGHRASRAVVSAARDRRLPGIFVPQVLLEAFAVVTDRRRVTSPLAPDLAWEEIDGLARTISVLYPNPQALQEFARIVERRGPKAQSVFDAFLVAQMRAAGSSAICTYNVADFEGYEGISAETPDATVVRFRLSM